MILACDLGAWYNGSIGVSKTFDGSSILSAPANIEIKKELLNFFVALFLYYG